jgi:hypothetical protein
MYAYDLLELLQNRSYRVVLDEGVEVTGQVKVLGERQDGNAHTAVFARIAYSSTQADLPSRLSTISAKSLINTR